MIEVNYEKFKKSLERLKEQYNNYKLHKHNLTDLNKEGIKESVIKRFEICYDTLWKHLKKYLQTKENLIDLPNSPNGVFRKAYEADVIDEKMLKFLMNYNTLRSMAAHGYDEVKAQKSFDSIENFIQSATTIYQIISGEEK